MKNRVKIEAAYVINQFESEKGWEIKKKKKNEDIDEAFAKMDMQSWKSKHNFNRQ